jgi:hypothetical protein
MEEVGLMSLQSEVVYDPVQYDGSAEPYWLPQTALVEARSRRQHWQNVHRFEQYRRFTVDTKIRVAEPQ